MFEKWYENMVADVWFDDIDCQYASEEGIGEFVAGFNKLTSSQAENIIGKYEGSLMGKHYSSKMKRLISQRNAIVTAFGPEMASRVGYA